MLSQCLTLTTPFLDHHQPVQTCVNIYTDRRTAPPALDYRRLGSKHAVALIDALLDRDTGRRLRGEGLRLHPFFWGLDWAALQRRQLAPPHEHYTEARAGEARDAFAEWERTQEERGGASDEPASEEERLPDGWESMPGW